jgi:hypothetical protein
MSQQALSAGKFQISAAGNFSELWHKGKLHGTLRTEGKSFVGFGKKISKIIIVLLLFILCHAQPLVRASNSRSAFVFKFHFHLREFRAIPTWGTLWGQGPTLSINKH